MDPKEYAHALGQQLETCEDPVVRAQIARMLAATGSVDAQPYLLEAISRESDDDARAAIRDALRTLAETGGGA